MKDDYDTDDWSWEDKIETKKERERERDKRRDPWDRILEDEEEEGEENDE